MCSIFQKVCHRLFLFPSCPVFILLRRSKVMFEFSDGGIAVVSWMLIKTLFTPLIYGSFSLQMTAENRLWSTAHGCINLVKIWYPVPEVQCLRNRNIQTAASVDASLSFSLGICPFKMNFSAHYCSEMFTGQQCKENSNHHSGKWHIR